MKVLVLDTVDSHFFETLGSWGWELVEEYQAPAAEIDWKQYQGMIIRSRMPINAEVLEQATNLKFIARVGAGLENIDVEAAQKRNIQVMAAPEGNRHALGEHALAMLLSLFNRLIIADREVRHGLWRREENRGYELGAKTVGIIGFGYMGSAFAEKLRGFGCRILAYDKYKENYAPEYVEAVSREQLMAEADVISLHLPQNEETLYYVDEKFINEVNKPFYLINTARGKLVRTDALAKALESGQVQGACLDVLEYEKDSFEDIYQGETPSAFKLILSSDKVILSPHIGGWSHESKLEMAKVLVEKIKKEFKDDH